jgi:hypothetical protein
MKKVIIGLAILIILITGIWLLLDNKEEIQITNFNECINAGNPVMESYPRQCIDSKTDTTFIEEIDEIINEPTPEEPTIEVPATEEPTTEAFDMTKATTTCNSLCEVDADAYCEEERNIRVNDIEIIGTCRAFSQKHDVSGFNRCEGFCSSYSKTGTKCKLLTGETDSNCDGIKD